MLEPCSLHKMATIVFGENVVRRNCVQNQVIGSQKGFYVVQYT